MQRSQKWFLPCTWGNTGGNNLPCEESHSDSTKQMLHRTLSPVVEAYHGKRSRYKITLMPEILQLDQWWSVKFDRVSIASGAVGGQQQSTVSTGGGKAVCKILVGVWRRYHECISGLGTSKYSAGGEARVDLTFLETGPKILQTIPSHKNASARNNFTKTLFH